MKYFLTLIFSLIFTVSVYAAPLEAGVSLDEIPDTFYGSWQVRAKLEETNAADAFKPQSTDFWNLSRKGDFIRLDNPLSGANCEISIKAVEGNLIVFSKRIHYDGNKYLTDTVRIRLGENTFSGYNTLTLEMFSLIDNHLMKTQTATYVINGEKISN